MNARSSSATSAKRGLARQVRAPNAVHAERGGVDVALGIDIAMEGAARWLRFTSSMQPISMMR